MTRDASEALQELAFQTYLKAGYFSRLRPGSTLLILYLGGDSIFMKQESSGMQFLLAFTLAFLALQLKVSAF